MASNETVFRMRFGKIYRLLLDKAVKKGRTEEEVHQVTAWLTGYSPEFLLQAMDTDLTYGDFFRQAPHPNPNREKIKGVVCGVRVEAVEDPLMREMRYLDKLVDELAKGKAMEAVLRQNTRCNRKTGPSPLLRRDWVRFFYWESVAGPHISRRPSRARMRVASSAYSRWLPTGMP